MQTSTIPQTVDQLDPNGYYTYTDYLCWTFPERVELFKGKPFKMSPAPNRRHQTISGRLYAHMFFYFSQNGCDIFSAPFDVRLPVSLKPGRVDTVVQPDICVVCDQGKLDKQGCNGAPDLVVEILSPGNELHEMREKFTLYETSGVREYWLVFPDSETVIPYVLNDGNTYIGLQPKTHSEQLVSHMFPEFRLNLATVFTYEE
jgi:Uma2 family endonuclease